jgi:hypothetical protein
LDAAADDRHVGMGVPPVAAEADLNVGVEPLAGRVLQAVPHLPADVVPDAPMADRGTGNVHHFAGEVERERVARPVGDLAVPVVQQHVRAVADAAVLLQRVPAGQVRAAFGVIFYCEDEGECLRRVARLAALAE